MRVGVNLRTGTIETEVKAGKALRRATKTKGFGTTGGDDRYGGDGGDNNGGPPNRPGLEDSAKLRIGMFFTLVTISTFFVLFAASYVWISSKSPPNWKPFPLPHQMWLGAMILAAGSLVYRNAQTAFCTKIFERANKYLSTTIFLGGMFLAMQILTWRELAARDIPFVGNPYGIFVYVTTVIFTIHMTCAVAALGCLMIALRKEQNSRRETEKSETNLQAFGWLWHFSVVLWASLVALLNFWR